MYGPIIMKKNTNISSDINNITDEEFGKLLGYPCAGEHIKHMNYRFHVIATYKNYNAYIFSMICKEKNNTKIDNFITKINNLLKILFS